MIFNGKTNTIYISKSVQSIFEKFKQSKISAPESGGIILGQVKGNTIHITKATTPSKSDSGSRFNFIRDKEFAQLIVDYEFYNNEGYVIYLGEWHTHPEEIPSPSTQDVKMIKNQFTSNTLNIDLILMLIIGIKGIYLGIYDGKELCKGIQKIET